MIYFNPSNALENFKSLSVRLPSKLDAIRSQEIAAEEVLPPPDCEEASCETDSSSFLGRCGTALFNIALIVTVIPLLVKILIEYQKQKEYHLLVSELEKLKWRGFFHSGSIDTLIGNAHDKEKFQEKALLFINAIPEDDFKDSPLKESIIADIENGNSIRAFRKLKEHYQITSFYKAYTSSLTPIKGVRNHTVQKTHEIFQNAKAYMEGNLNESRDVRDLYLRVTSMRSNFLITSWIEGMHQRLEMTTTQRDALLSHLDEGDGQGFISQLKEIIEDKTQKTKSEGPNIGFYFYTEINDALAQIDPSKGIHEFGQLLSPLFFYQDLFTKLDEAERNINLMIDAGGCIDAAQMRDIKGLLKEAEANITTSIAADILDPPPLDYQFRTIAGLLRRKFSEINDTVSLIGDPEESHELCGCHHSYTAQDDKKKSLFNRQVVDIKKSRINLEIKSAKVAEKIQRLEDSIPAASQDTVITNKIVKLNAKQAILTADIAALKRSEKGPKNAAPKKPMILGLTCSFGSGHKSPMAAVAKLIGSDHAHFFGADGPDDILKPACTVHKFGKFFGQDWKKSDAYTYIIQKQWFWIPKLYLFIARIIKAVSNFFFGPATPAAPVDSKDKELIRKRLLMEMPDHIMTFYHMDLQAILEVAEEMGIPTTHFATDFNAKMEHAFGELPPTHPMFKLVVAGDSDETLDSASPISEKDIITSTGAVRPLFLAKTDENILAEMRQERGIDDNTSTVLFMGGGYGQAIDFPEQLAADTTIQEKLHLIVIAGGHKGFGDHFEDLAKQGVLTKEGAYYKGSNPNITIEVAVDPAVKTKNTPYYIGESAMSRYFDLADVLYTKPGGSTTFEALAKGLTTVFDSRGSLMYWEEENMAQTIDLGLGLKNSTDAGFLEDLRQAIALSKTNEKKQRNLKPIDQVVHERLAMINENPNSWQKSKFSHYRFDLASKALENECIII